MTQPAYILICGRDAELLETRGLVLRSAGFHVSTTVGPIAMSPGLGTVDLLIVCHTLSAQERQADLSALAESSSAAKSLCLSPSRGPDESCGATLDSFAGPRAMLARVAELLGA